MSKWQDYFEESELWSSLAASDIEYIRNHIQPLACAPAHKIVQAWWGFSHESKLDTRWPKENNIHEFQEWLGL